MSRAPAQLPLGYVRGVTTGIAWLAYATAFVAVVASYGTQVDLLLRHGAKWWFAWMAPATVDLPAVAAALLLTLPYLPRLWRTVAGAITFITVTVSSVANATGAPNAVMAVAHVWPVVAYLLGELLAVGAGLIRGRLEELAANRARGLATAAANKSRRQPLSVAELERADLPTAPVSPPTGGPGRPRIATTRSPSGGIVRADGVHGPSDRTKGRRRAEERDAVATS